MAWFQGGRIKSSVLFSQIRWNSITILFRLNNSLFFVETKQKKIKKLGFQIQMVGSHWDLKAISKEEFKSCVLDLRTNFTALLTLPDPLLTTRQNPCAAFRGWVHQRTSKSEEIPPGNPCWVWLGFSKAPTSFCVSFIPPKAGFWPGLFCSLSLSQRTKKLPPSWQLVCF